MKNLFSNKLNIFLIIFILIFLIYCLNIKQPDIENLVNNENCIPVKNTNIVDSVNCNIEANNIWINNYKRRNNLCNNNKCSINNYLNKLSNINKLGNYKISMKCEPVPECICNDNLRCAYVPDNNGNMKLQKICKVISNKMTNLLDSSPDAVINNTPFYKIPNICNYPNLQKGWYYQPNYKLDQVKSIYEKTPNINNICSENKYIVQEENTVQPEMVTTSVVQPEMVPTSVVQPEMVPTSVVQPEMVQPEMVQPEIVQPEMVQPEMVQSKIVQPEIVQPEIVKPEMVQPKVVKPVFCSKLSKVPSNFNGNTTNDSFIFNNNSFIIPSSVAPNMTKQFTIEFWAKISTIKKRGTIFVQGPFIAKKLLLIRTLLPSDIYMEFLAGSLRYSITPYLNKWSHYAFTYYPGGSKFFVNGNEIKCKQNWLRICNAAIINGTNSKGNISIGNGPQKFGFDGELKKLKVFNTVRTQQQIQQSANNPNPNEPCPTDALLYIPMNSNDKNIYYTKVQPVIQKKITFPLKSGEKLKPGNDGTVNGTTFCRGNWQGWSANNCVRMRNNDSDEYLDCSIVPYSKTNKKGNYTVTCSGIYANQKIKPGNNGTVNGNTFCRGNWQGWSAANCRNMTAQTNGRVIDCNTVPGLGSGGPSGWKATCQNPYPNQKIKPGNNGTVNGNTFCRGNWQGWSAANCINMTAQSKGRIINCNTVPGYNSGGSSGWKATCQNPYRNQKLKGGNNGTASGNTYCRGRQWLGWSGNCINMTARAKGRVIGCNAVPGLNSGGPPGWIATCRI